MADRTLALTGGTALLGAGLDVVEDATVVMVGATIAAAGHRSHTPIPPGAEVVDATGTTVLPGFIDAHVHIGFSDPFDVLRGGVTTVRDLGWPPEDIFPLAAASLEPAFAGPRVLAVGQMLTVDGGYPTRARWAPEGTGRVVRSLEDAALAVEEQALRGACAVKVALNPEAGPTLPRDLLAAIVDAAHVRGLRVTGHVFGLTELDKALDAGMDELAHMLMSPERIPDATIERMVRQGTTVVPTMSVFAGDALSVAGANLERFLAAGGDVVYGTDLGNEGPRPGIDRREIEAMSRAGMSSIEVIASATTRAAERLWLHETGILAEGAAGDVIAVRGDATLDARALSDVRIVVRAGRRIV